MTGILWVFTVAVLFASLMNIKKCVDEDGQKVLNFTMLTLHLTAFFIVGIDAIVIVVSSFFKNFHVLAYGYLFGMIFNCIVGTIQMYLFYEIGKAAKKH